jgi:hypothetical protein
VFLVEDLEAARRARRAITSRGRILNESRLLGGTTAHRAVGKAVGRQIDGVLQAQEQARLVARTVGLIVDITSARGCERSRGRSAADDLQLRLIEQQRADGLVLRLDDLAAGFPAPRSTPGIRRKHSRTSAVMPKRSRRAIALRRPVRGL